MPECSAPPKTVLVVEDDRSLREGLKLSLDIAGYTVLCAADGEEGMRLAFDRRPDLIVLDIMLPGWSGLEILQELRKRGETVPVLLLSALGSIPQKVRGLDLGADDYLSKPFDLKELLARINVMLRRKQATVPRDQRLTIGNICIDIARRCISVGDRSISLSAKEFDLLCLLAGTPGQVFTREQILERVWGWGYEGTERTVDNVVARLRNKLKDPDHIAGYLQTVPCVGYKFQSKADKSPRIAKPSHG